MVPCADYARSMRYSWQLLWTCIVSALFNVWSRLIGIYLLWRLWRGWVCSIRNTRSHEGHNRRIEPRGRSTYARICFDEYGERAFAADHVSLYIME